MALIQCSECGQQVSDKATICPKCGAPIMGVPISNKSENEREIFVKLGYVFSITSYFIFPFIFGVFGFALGVINLIRKEELHGIIQIMLAVFALVVEFSDEI